MWLCVLRLFRVGTKDEVGIVTQMRRTFEELLFLWRSRPAGIFVGVVLRRLLGWKIWRRSKRTAEFGGRIGLEIGGPSAIFRSSGQLPIYPVAARIDNCDFAIDTLWTKRNAPNPRYDYGEGGPGFAYTMDATAIGLISDCSYDFVLSCNSLEHIANPLQALLEWKRVLKYRGIMVLIVPRKESNFDRHREVTAMQHLVGDYVGAVQEDDMTHREEILSLHDLSLDPLAGTREMFASRCADNTRYRGMHHHVYDPDLLRAIMRWLSLEVVMQRTTLTDHVILGRKLE